MTKIAAITSLFLSILVSTLFLSCDKEKIDYGVEDPIEQGELSFASLTFTVDAQLVTKGEVETGNYKVCIYNANNELALGKVYSYTELPKVIALKVGTYRVVVQSEATMPESSDNPFYAGSQSIDIKKNKVTELDKIVCTLATTKVTVAVDAASFDGEIAPGYQVQVNNGGTGIYSFTETDIKSEKAKYFKTEIHKVLNITLTGKRPDGQSIREASTISNVKGGEWRKVKVSVVQTGTLKSALKIDSSMEEVNTDIKVPVEDDIIKPDPDPDPENPGNPDPNPDPTPGDYTLTILGDGFNIDQSISVPMVTTTPENPKTVIVNISASKGLNNLFVEINSETLTEDILTEVGLSKRFDLAYPGALKEGLQGLGLPTGDDVKGQTAIVFNITEFTPMLGIYGVATHKFIIRAVDAAGNEVKKTLTLISE